MVGADAVDVPEDAYLVAVVGIPGSGKSTFAGRLSQRVEGGIALPMDGYHLPRAVLDEEGRRRRGAPWTFDVAKLRGDLTELRRRREGLFPAFDHARKDPEAEAIEVTGRHRLVVVEGLYLLLAEWQLAPLFDFAVFVECGVEEAMARLVRRHVVTGVCSSEAEARQRVDANDRLNAEIVLADGCRERADQRVWGGGGGGGEG